MSILHLQHLRSDGERDVFHLKDVRRYHLGRGSTCELRILDMKMSRKHCAIEYQDGVWKLLDLGSTNGVNVDGERVSGEAILNGGETIAAGGSELSVLAISDHVDLAPEELMLLGENTSPPEQESMPSVTEDVPVAANDNPWEGEPQGESSSRDEQALEENRPTVVIQRAAAADPVEGSGPLDLADNSDRRAPLRTPLPEPANALPHQDGDALEAHPGHQPQVDAGIRAAASGTDQHKPSGSESIVVTLLGRRIGPLSRDTARELKKKQIMGTLTEAELGQYPSA